MFKNVYTKDLLKCKALTMLLLVAFLVAYLPGRKSSKKVF